MCLRPAVGARNGAPQGMDTTGASTTLLPSSTTGDRLPCMRTSLQCSCWQTLLYKTWSLLGRGGGTLYIVYSVSCAVHVQCVFNLHLPPFCSNVSRQKQRPVDTVAHCPACCSCLPQRDSICVFVLFVHSLSSIRTRDII